MESNPEPPVLTVECDVEQIDWDYEPFDDRPYASWHYDGLPLIPRKLEQLGDLTTDLIDELEDTDTDIENVISLTESLLLEHLYDTSREMTRARYRIERLLSMRKEPACTELATRMRQQKGMLMRHENRDQVARYLFVELPRQLLQKGLESSHYTYDNRLDELEQQLRAFPFQLYDKFLTDPVDFLREVYYHHVPRRYLNQLLSGIVLMILKRRVKIQRWGREGDTEPIEQIENGYMANTKAHPKLSSEKASVYWKRLEEAGFVDKAHRLLPSTTRIQAAYIAEMFAEELNIREKWKAFEEWWGIKNLAQEKYHSLETGHTPSREDDINEIFKS